MEDLGDAMFCQKRLHESCRMVRRIDADPLIVHSVIVKARVTQYTSSVNGVSLPTD